MVGWLAAATALAGVDETHDALRKVKAEMERALNARDVDAIVANAAPDVVFTTMNGDTVRGRDGVKAYFAKMMGGTVKSVEATFTPADLSILYGDDAAVSWGASKAHFVLADGEDFQVDAQWTATLVHEDDGAWRVAAFHYSTPLWDNPVVDASKRWAGMLAAGVGLVGALGGAAAGWFLGRRR